MGDKRIKKGSEAGVWIIGTEVLLTETFEDDDHNVGSGGIDRCWRMEGGVKGVDLIGGKVVGDGESRFTHGADKGEGGVEDYGSFSRLVDVLVGVADGDGADGRGGTATHADNRQGDVEEDEEGGEKDVLPPGKRIDE